MAESLFEALPPEIVSEQPDAEIPPAVEEPISTPVVEVAAPAPLSLPPTTIGAEFIDWMQHKVLPFLDLADLERVKTAEALRGQKEHQIRDKIQAANSMLVLLANYGSDTDDEDLVKWCELYAEKMKTIIKRLCL